MLNCVDEILGRSLTLFCENGYENVTIRDIAEAAGIAPSEIYRFYDSKDAILEAVYRRYCDTLLANAPSPEEYIPILEEGTAEDIVRIFAFDMPEPHDVNFSAFMILMARRASDKRAKDIYLRNAWEPSLSYIKDVLRKGVEIGRLNMSFEDINAFAHHILAIREYASTIALFIPDKAIWQKADRDMLAQVSTLIMPYIVARNEAPAAGDTLDILAESIRVETLAVGKYYHYSVVLKRRGQNQLAALVNEVVANILDEINTLYGFSDQRGELLSNAEIVRLIADNERLKKLEAEKAAEVAGKELGGVFLEIAELAQQHERICLSAPPQEGSDDHA